MQVEALETDSTGLPALRLKRSASAKESARDGLFQFALTSALERWGRLSCGNRSGGQ